MAVSAQVCPNCATENLPGARFCMECATPFAAACPSCGATNMPAAKFCSNCATPLAGGRPRPVPAGAIPMSSAGAGEQTAERRLVTVLFADLVGFTAYSDGRDAEEIRELQTRYFETVRDIIDRYGGRVEKFIGDAVMALWGAPVAREDDAERAVRAAFDLVGSVRGLGSGIELRVGVLTGEAAVTLGATDQGMVAGDMVNTASRLQGVAPPSTVLVGEATMRAAGDAIVFEPVDDLALKGKVTPVPAWRAIRVVAQRGGVGRAEGMEAPFVGRDEELRQLRDLFHATSREGRPRLVSVIGPAGIGKSRLAWEFLKYIDGLVEPVWWHDGRSPAYGDGITFWALGEMIRGRAGLHETDDEPTTRAAIATMLEEHLIDEAERAWIAPAMLHLLGFEGGAAADQLFGAWRTFFERLASTQSVVLVFEDLHHADPGLLDFIDHLLEWSRSSSILIVTLARPELLDRRPDWGAGKRSFTSIHLEPLSVDSMRELLSGLVPGLPAAARDAVVSRADGIPLYAVEIVRMLLSQGKLLAEGGVYRPAGDLTDLAVPETLTALIAARLDELDPSDRAVLADAAVLGQSFTMAGVAAVAGESPADVEPHLRALVRREMLIQNVDARSPERGQYGFVQALIREVAYNTLARRDRQTRHLAAARFFESLGTDELAGAQAGHYLAALGYASDGPEADALAAQARIALRGAADRAASLGAHEQALTFLDHALVISPAAADRADLNERALASARQGLVADVAIRYALGAVEALRELGDRERTAEATAEYGAVLAFYSASEERAAAVLDAAWDEFADLEGTRAGVALMLALSAAYGISDQAAALGWIERLLPIAERLDMLPEIATALMRRASGLWRNDRAREAMIVLRGTHELAVANGLVDVHRSSRTQLTFYEQFDDPVAGLAMAREGLEIAARQGSALYGFQMVGNGAVCALRTGDWDWAEGLLADWLSNEITGQFYLELFADRAIVTAVRGADPSADMAEADRLLPGISDPQYASYVHWARAWVSLCAGRLGEAARSAAAAVDATSYFGPLATPLAARAALWAGDIPAAVESARRMDTAVYRGLAIGLDLATIRAGIAALEGRRTDAIAGYREVLRGWRTAGLTFDEALATVDMATVLAPTEREMPEAATDIAEARATLIRLGARPFLERLGADGAMVADRPSRVAAQAMGEATPTQAG